jgi:hypothetical protein
MKKIEIPIEDIEIFSTWGKTTKVMKRAVARVREEFQGLPEEHRNDKSCRNLYAVMEYTTRFKKCGEAISREMVERVCRYYGADAEGRWAKFTEPFGGPEQVSPDYKHDPTFLNPRIKGKLEAWAESELATKH